MSKEQIHQRKQHLRRIANIPRRFKEASFDNWIATTPPQKDVLETVTNFADKFIQLSRAGFGGVVLHGNVGTGKTHLGCALIKAVVQRYMATAKYINAFELISKIRETWSDRTLHESSVIDAMASYDLLVIDEIGVQYGTKAEQISLFQVINQRSLAMKPTVLITNLDKQQLIEAIGERTVDRIFENKGGFLPFNWTSLRGETCI